VRKAVNVNKSSSNKSDVIDIYRKRARGYDASGIAGLEAWRREAVHLLNLKRGDVVVDIGCGTGLNIALLQEAVGPEGKIIGVDLTDAMLEQARQRVTDNGWNNVELVQSDAVQYEFPKQVDGVVSAFALTFIPDCARVIQHGSQALAPGRMWVVLDMAWPARLPIWARHILFFLSSYGISADVVRRRPWELVQQAMKQHLVDVTSRHFWLGFFYLASGRRPK
jgi:demethylmenaquinone methyltransferase/2-methoxy-6-polyprenyl-1,4-benzoquinol methylase